jgi:pilus assembly protein CpaB
MNRSRLFMIGFVALALGAIASMAVYKSMAKGAGSNQPGVGVVIAATDLQVGAKVGDNDIKVVNFPASDLPQGFYQKAAQVTGRGVILPISKGEFILPNKLAAPNAGAGLPSLIPPGMRAVSIKVTDVVSVAGFVLPGTRVDVMLTGNPNNSNQQQTTTVLENVAVLATGQKLERNSQGEPSTAPVITLLVSPDDAQKLALASSQGKIQLALRNPLDSKQEELAAARSDSLYKIEAAPPPKPRPVTAKKAAPPTPPQAYSVEIIRGNKKEDQKFDQVPE